MVFLSVMSVMVLCCRLWPFSGNAIFGELQVTLSYDLSFTLNRGIHCKGPHTTLRNFKGFLEQYRISCLFLIFDLFGFFASDCGKKTVGGLKEREGGGDKEKE